MRSKNATESRKTAGQASFDQTASPDLPSYYVNLFYPTLFGLLDFLTPGVKLQSFSVFLKKTLACESAYFMIISSVECRKSPKTRAFWRSGFCRRIDIERPTSQRCVIAPQCKQLRVQLMLYGGQFCDFSPLPPAREQHTIQEYESDRSPDCPHRIHPAYLPQQPSCRAKATSL